MSADHKDSQYTFSLSDIPPEKRSKVWQDSLNEFFYDYDFKIPEDFRDGNFKGCHIGDISFASIRSDAMSVYRTASHVSRSPHDYYFLLLPRGSKIQLTQRNNQANVGNGEFSLVSADEPYTYVQRGNELFNNLIIPGSIMRQFTPTALSKVALPSNGSAIAKVFTDMANSLCENIGNFSKQSETALVGMLVNMLELILDDVDYCSNQKTVKVAHRRRVLQLIEKEFRNPNFGVQRISEALKISPRYIHKLFSDTGESISDVVRARRIREARHVLTLRGCRNVHISTLAYDVGFSNSSHFTKVFKDETGVAPSSYYVTRSTNELPANELPAKSVRQVPREDSSGSG